MAKKDTTKKAAVKKPLPTKPAAEVSGKKPAAPKTPVARAKKAVTEDILDLPKNTSPVRKRAVRWIETAESKAAKNRLASRSPPQPALYHPRSKSVSSRPSSRLFLRLLRSPGCL